MKLLGFTRSKIVVLFVLLAAAIAAVVHFTGIGPGGGQKLGNVILISIDTCRADRLSCYGFDKQTTPNIDAVAAEGILFRNAAAPTGLTRPSHATMLTGMIPPYHGVHANGFAWLEKHNTTLAEILKEHEYETAAMISSFIMDSQFGLDQGFDVYNDDYPKPTEANQYPERRGEEVTQLAGKWLEQHREQPFFLFAHYYDPHDPYDPPEPFATQFADDLYSGEIAYADFCIGKLIQKIKSLCLYDSSLIIITADHGESLGEHNEPTHGYFVYDSVIKVPLIVKPPGGCQARVVSEIAGLIDIVPTILKQLKIPVPEAVTGQDLSEFAFDTPKTAEARYIYCESLMPVQYECNPLLAVVGKNWKYIETRNSELYDLIADPGETNNVITEHADQVKRMRSYLHSVLDNPTSTTQQEARGLDDETIAHLESLGYTASSHVSEIFEIDPAKDDPKDLVDYHHKKIIISDLMEKGMFEQAQIMLQNIQARQPNQALTYRMMGQIATIAGDTDTAIAHYTRSVQLKPDDYLSRNNLATTLYQKGRAEEAIEHWQKAVSINVKGRLARMNLAEALNQLGRKDEAIEQWQEMIRLEIDPSYGHRNVGKVMTEQGRNDEAIEHWTAYLQLQPEDAQGHHNLATAHYRQGNIKQAIAYWTTALKLQPEWANILSNLAWVLATTDSKELRDPARAVELAQQAAKLTSYDQPDVMDVLSVAYAADGKFPKAIETAERALKLANIFERKKLAKTIQDRLNLYKSGRPFNKTDDDKKKNTP